MRAAPIPNAARDWYPPTELVAELQLARVFNHFRQIAVPSRDKLSCLVRASDLFELGISLMDTCGSGADRPA